MDIKDLDRAKRVLVHQYKGPFSDLAEAAGCSEKVLYNKTNPNNDTHHLTVDEAVKIQKFTKTDFVLQAEARALGYVCISLGDFANSSDVELLNIYTQLVTEFGQHAHAVRSSLEDGVIELDEADQIALEFFDVIRVGFELQARVDAIAGVPGDRRRVCHEEEHSAVA